MPNILSSKIKETVKEYINNKKSKILFQELQNKLPLNYEILQNENLYTNVFLEKINKIIEIYKNKVRVDGTGNTLKIVNNTVPNPPSIASIASGITSGTSIPIQNIMKNIKYKESKNEEAKKKHKENIIKYYIIPVAYLIYSFIYTKYYNIQFKKNIDIQNDLNYKMYSFVFDHRNPIIKKVNISLHNEFNGITKNNNTKNTNNNNNTNISSKMNILSLIIKQKDDLINFLTYMINNIKIKNNYEKKLEIYDNIDFNFKKIIDYIKKLIDIFNSIKLKNPIINYEYTRINTIINDINKINSNHFTQNLEQVINVYKYNTIDSLADSLKIILDKISYNKRNTLFETYKEDYYKALNIYENILVKIDSINLSLLDLNLDKYKFIYDDDIKINYIFERYIISLYERNEINKKKIESDEKNQNISKIIEYYNDQKEIYEELFKLITNINNKNKKLKELKIENFYKTIDSIFEEIKSNLKNYFKNNETLNVPINKNFINTYFQKSQLNIDKPINSAISLDDLFKLFLKSLFINNYIEYHYINNINNINIRDKTNIDSKLLTNSKIEEIQFYFNNRFRDYKKTSINYDNNKYLTILENEKKNIEDDISNLEFIIDRSLKNTSITSYEAELVKIEENIKNKNTEITQYDTKKKDIDKIVDIYNINIYNQLNDNTFTKNIIISIIIEIKNKEKELERSSRNRTTFNKLTVEIDYLEELLKGINSRNAKYNSIKSQINKEINTIIQKIYLDFKRKYRDITKIDSIIQYMIINKIGKSEYNEIKKKENEYISKLSQSNKNDFLELNYIDRIKFLYDKYTKNKENTDLKWTTLKSELKDLDINKKSYIELIEKIKKNNDLNNRKKINLESIKTKIINKITEITNKTTTRNSENKTLKDDFNHIFDEIISITKKYEEIIDNDNNNNNNNKTINKLLSSYNKNKNFIKIMDDLVNLHKVSNVSRLNNIIEKYTLEISNYFNKNNDAFINELKKLFTNKKNNINLFYTQFNDYYNDIINKINILLHKINSNVLKLKKINITEINLFKNNIIGLKQKREETLGKNILNNYSNKKGKYIVILPYTDIIYKYIINLLIIIDYLVYFYE